MTVSISDLQVALAIAPFAGVMVLRELWARRKHDRELRAREAQARTAPLNAVIPRRPPASVNVVEVAARVARSYRCVADAKGLRFLTILPDDAESLPLDRSHLEQALMHLVDNAVKFTASGTVKLTLVKDASNRPTRLVVADTGNGLPPDEIERIVRPIDQAGSRGSPPLSRAGFGLPLARELCDTMGCTLAVESHPGTGSRFSIRFPARR